MAQKKPVQDNSSAILANTILQTGTAIASGVVSGHAREKVDAILDQPQQEFEAAQTEIASLGAEIERVKKRNAGTFSRDELAILSAYPYTPEDFPGEEENEAEIFAFQQQINKLKLASAQARGPGLAAARARAKSLLRREADANPFARRRLQSIAADITGGIGGAGTGAGAIDPHTKGLLEAEQEISKIIASMGLEDTPDVRRVIMMGVRQKRRLQRLKDAEEEHLLLGGQAERRKLPIVTEEIEVGWVNILQQMATIDANPNTTTDEQAQEKIQAIRRLDISLSRSLARLVPSLEGDKLRVVKEDKDNMIERLLASVEDDDSTTLLERMIATRKAAGDWLDEAEEVRRAHRMASIVGALGPDFVLQLQGMERLFGVEFSKAFPGSSVADFFKDALFADVPYSRYIKSLKAGDRGPLSPSQTILIADMAIRISASTPDVDSVGAAEDRRKWAEMALEAGDTPTLIKRTADSVDYQEAAKASPQDYEGLIESNIALVVPELFGLPLEGLRVLYSAETGTAAVVEVGSNGVPVQNFGSFALGNRPVLIGGRPFFRQSEQVLDKVLEDLPKGERQVSEDALKSLLYTAQTIDSLKDLTKSKFDFGNSSEYFDFLIQTLQPVDEPEKLEVEDPAENVEDDIPIMSPEDVLEFVPRKYKDAARRAIETGKAVSVTTEGEIVE